MKNLTACLSLAVFCFLSTIAFSQTTFTGSNSEIWADAGNWDNGLPAVGNDAIIPDGLSIINKGNITNAGTITNHGTINNVGTITNAGTITNDGTIVNGGDILNNGDIDNLGYILNGGTINNDGSWTGDYYWIKQDIPKK